MGSRMTLGSIWETFLGDTIPRRSCETLLRDTILYPIGSMYAIYGNIYHQYTPNVTIYGIHGSYGYIYVYILEETLVNLCCQIPARETFERHCCKKNPIRQF